MNIETKQAIEESIAHWERMRDAELEDWKEECPSSNHCALCKMFLDETDCMECPIYLKTNKKRCHNTPYGDAGAIWSEIEFLLCAVEPVPEELLSSWKEAAQKEIDFLKSLLPKEQETEV